MDLSTRSTPLATPHRLAHTLDQTLLATPSLLGLLVLRRDGAIEHVAGEDEAALEGLAAFAIGSFELLERMTEEGGLGGARWVMAHAREGRIIIHALDGDRLLFAIAGREAPLGALVHDLGWCAQLLTSAPDATRRRG